MKIILGENERERWKVGGKAGRQTHVDEVKVIFAQVQSGTSSSVSVCVCAKSLSLDKIVFSWYRENLVKSIPQALLITTVVH